MMFVAGLQAYTIRKMDQYMPTGRDIDHYKLLSVHEQQLDNRQKYLDVLCFPSLFSTGKYGEFHPRTVKLTFSEYLKSKLIRGTKQFWYRQKEDVLAMIREFGCPTLFLTFSCAEYDSVDIDRYLRKVNEVTPSYPI